MSEWTLIVNQAEKNLLQQNIWTSFIEQREYQVYSVGERRIEIRRLSGGQNFILTPGIAETAIAQLRRQNQVRHGNLIRNVAKECALIQFHPNISWDRASGNIVWRPVISTQVMPIEELIEEAPDDEFEKILVAVNRRKYQSTFRQNLMQVYGSKCVVSGTNSFEVLEAAHISTHAGSRNNDTSNGLLLRADLHILFDRGLLQIHPTTLKIHLSPTIQEPEYTRYTGNLIIERLDGKKPSEAYLQAKWESADWTG